MLDLSNNYTLPAYVHNVTLDRITKLASFPKFSLKEGYEEGVKALNSVLNPGTTPFDVPKYEEVKPYYEKFEKDANSTEALGLILSPAGAVAGITVVGGGASAAATKFQE